MFNQRKAQRILPGLVAVLLLCACAPVEPESDPAATSAAHAAQLPTSVPAQAETPTPVPPTETTIPLTHTPVPLTATPSSTATLTVEIDKSITYADMDQVRPSKLDVYAPDAPGPWPVVVTVHGIYERRLALAGLAEAISSHGAVVYNIDARFTVPLFTGIERLACAVRYARATAPDYDGDPSWIAIVGSSAGAASGLVVALAGDDFQGDCVVSDGSALPDALVAFEGPYEFATTNYGDELDHTYLQEEDPELLDAFDPYSHIGRNPDLQIRLIHGDDKDIVWYEIPLAESIELHQALADAGYDVELTILDGTWHGDLAKRFTEATEAAVQQTIELAHSSSH